MQRLVLLIVVVLLIAVLYDATINSADRRIGSQNVVLKLIKGSDPSINFVLSGSYPRDSLSYRYILVSIPKVTDGIRLGYVLGREVVEESIKNLSPGSDTLMVPCGALEFDSVNVYAGQR